MPGDLDYFYHYLQLRRDQDNAVVCCGTSYVARRQALLSVGGYFSRCLVEDYQTGTKLMTQGWKVLYLNEVLSMGEVPRTFADFLDQRLRWMQGNIQIFFCGKDLPIFQSLSLRQLRWYALPADLLAPLWRFIYLAMPLLGMILGFSVITAPVLEFMAYGGPFVIALYTLPNWLSGHYHHQFWVEVYETLFCFPALARMRKVLRHPFRVYGGIVTNKDVATEDQRFNLKLSWPLLILLLLILVTAVIRYVLPALGILPRDSLEFEGEGVILGWNLYNALVLSVALLACIDKPVQAGADRFPIQHVARLELDGHQYWGTTRAMAEDWILLELQSSLPRGLAGQGRITLLEPDLVLEVQLGPQHDRSVELTIVEPSAAGRTALFRLLYSTEHWFHAPRPLRTGDALLHWLSTLWRPDPLLRRSP